MTPTTPDQIVAALITAIQALDATPTILNDKDFTLHEAVNPPLRQWAPSQGGMLTFRVFEVEWAGTRNDASPTQGPDLAYVEAPFTILVAYPMNQKLYGFTALNELRDLISKDAWQIRNAVFDIRALANDGHQANLVRETRVDRADAKVWFLELVVVAKFFTPQ